VVAGVRSLAQLEDLLSLYNGLGECQDGLREELGRVFSQVPERIIMPNLWG